MMRVRTLAALAAAVLAVGVLPASAQQDGGGLPTDGLPTDGLTDGLGGGGGGQGQAQQQVPDAPGDFIATADGGALEINLAGQSLTVGHSEVGIQSSTDGAACDDGLACALASGEALLGESAEVNISAPGESDSDQAAALELDQLAPLLDASVSEATASASADDDDDTRDASAEGGILSADVSLTEGLLEDLPQDQLTGQLQDILNALQGTAGGDGGGNPLDGLTGQLDPLLGNLDTGQITDILSGSGLGLASTGGDGGGQTSPLQVAQQLVDANQALGGDGSSSDGGDGGGSADDGGGNDSADGEGGDGLLEGVIGDGDGDGEASADADAGADAGGDGGGDVDASARGSLEAGEAGQAPSPQEVAAIIEQATGEAEASQVTDPTGLIGQLTGTLEQLVGGDLIGGDVASVRVGPTESQAGYDGNTASATAHSQGAVVVVLPTAESAPQDPQGLATVEVGRATVSANSDGEAPDAAFDPAVARVTVANPLADGGVEEIAVSPGQSECAGATPLELCVSVGSGSTTDTETGAAASANAVSIRALGGVLPELSVELAAANAGVNAGASDETAEPAEEPAPEPQQVALPETGGGAFLPGLLLLGAGAAGFAGLRRRR